MKREWKLCKNTETETPCWQLYYIEGNGQKRYFDCALSYPIAAALRDAINDDAIRAYVVEHTQLPINRAYAHRMANKTVYDSMIDLTKQYNGNDSIYERLVQQAIDAE